MRMIDKKTKIITTIGPSSETKEMIEKLFDAGMTTIRLNFSHGNHEEQGSRIKLAKQVSIEKNLPISVMLDTKGPEIRVGKFKDETISVESGQIITIFSKAEDYENYLAKENEMTVSYDLSQDLAPGKVVLVDDGKLQLFVEKVESGKVITKARNSHVVKQNKRINLPGTKFSMPFLSEKDHDDIRFGCQSGVDFIAASFVNTKEDIAEIREILAEQGSEHIKIISKIESQYAVDHFDEILKHSDGIMVARGDLGLEIPYYDVPVAQRMMVKKCRQAGKPVIVATQMLDSMEDNPHPTRAEVTDVYFATELGADATMLSGESAAGKYPVEAVEVMTKINLRAEREFYNKLFYPVQLKEVRKNSSGERSDIAFEVANKTIDGNYKFAIVLSRTGQLLAEVAKFRPNTAIIGVTDHEKQISQFGITASVFMHPKTDAFALLKNSKENAHEVLRAFNPKIGDKYLVVENHQIIEFRF